jgi:hypothetical protein
MRLLKRSSVACAVSGASPVADPAARLMLSQALSAALDTLGLGPLEIGQSDVRQRDAAAIVADTEVREARAKADPVSPAQSQVPARSQIRPRV